MSPQIDRPEFPRGKGDNVSPGSRLGGALGESLANEHHNNASEADTAFVQFRLP